MFKLTKIVDPKPEQNLCTFLSLEPCTFFKLDSSEYEYTHVYMKINNVLVLDIHISEIVTLLPDAVVYPIPDGTQITLTTSKK